MKRSRLAIQCSQWRTAIIGRLQAEGHWCGHGGPYNLDCIEPRGSWHHITGSYARVRFYEAEARAGNLQVLCIPCHNAKCRQESLQRKQRAMAAQDSHVKQFRILQMKQLVSNYEQKAIK
jgi:hypothetical protein